MKHMNITFWNIPSSSLKPGKKFSEDSEYYATENKTSLLQIWQKLVPWRIDYF